MIEVAIVGGGCFWCIEAAFNQLEGVVKAVSGYCGGHVPNPTYEQVCQKTTGHVEVVKVEFDPERISYGTILECFFALHDPTTLNRQGNDVGPQYRSAIFCTTLEQLHTASALIANLKQNIAVVTTLEPYGDGSTAQTFYQAEAYHQNYALQHPNEPYCAFVVLPKLAKFKKQAYHLLKS